MNTTQKRLIIAALAIVALGLGLFFSLTRGDQSSPSTQKISDDQIKVSLVDDAQGRQGYTDTDNDGAYDWEERLWPELDPNNPDSDGDGVLDGEYIKNQRQIQERQRVSREAETIESNLSETEKLGRLYLSALLAIEQSGAEITAQDQEQINKNIEEYIVNIPIGEKNYVRSDLTLVESNQDEVYAYRDAMVNIFTKYPVSTGDIELVILAYGEDNPQQSQGVLRAAEKKYQNYLDEILALEVPRVIGTQHVGLVNSISHLHGSFANILDQEQDELKSLSALLRLESTMTQVVETIVSINTFFEIVEDPSVFEIR